MSDEQPSDGGVGLCPAANMILVPGPEGVANDAAKTPTVTLSSADSEVAIADFLRCTLLCDTRQVRFECIQKSREKQGLSCRAHLVNLALRLLQITVLLFLDYCCMQWVLAI